MFYYKDIYKSVTSLTSLSSFKNNFTHSCIFDWPKKVRVMDDRKHFKPVDHNVSRNISWREFFKGDLDRHKTTQIVIIHQLTIVYFH